MSLRIIGGEYRRRQLRTPHGMSTRPYTDRVRQIAFDRLGDAIDGARIADVFSGVGTMGLESLSRGAASCVFIEGDPKVHALLSQNVAAIVKDKPTVCWKTNIHRTSFCPNGAEECLPYDLVFFDPPYNQCSLLSRNEALGKGLVRLAKPKASHADTIVVLRTPERVEFPESHAWSVDDHWAISTMNLWVLKKRKPDSTATDPESPMSATPKSPKPVSQN